MKQSQPLHGHGPQRFVRYLSLLAVALLTLQPFTGFAVAISAPTPHIALRQPPTAQIASALDLAAENALPVGYPTLTAVPHVPTVLLKAMAWVESRWQQFTAPDHPLVSSSGGYGIMQLTHGLGGVAIPFTVQSAIANNFVYNIACGAQVLSTKWATTPAIGNRNPAVLENWYYAVWAYNAWNWSNNPNNPRFTRKGTPMTNPRAFPYQERVFYALAHPPLDATGQPLWPAVNVTLPDPHLIGTIPGPLPTPTVAHFDVAPVDGPLLLNPLDAAEFEADMTIPDGTRVAPGSPLHKTWLIHNAGSRFWSDYTWRYVGGDTLTMTTPLTSAVPYVPPLADVPLSVDLTAPTRPGSYKSYWQLFNNVGQAVGGRSWLQITVDAALTETTALTQAAATPTAEGTVPDLPVTNTISPVATIRTSQSSVPTAVNNAGYVADISVPDGSVLVPGQSFTKIWAIQNTGTRTWDQNYHWQFEAGAPLGTVRSVPATRIAPGATEQFSVDMVAPDKPGSYRGYWQMVDPSGHLFGSQAWVSIVVQSPSRPTATATSAPTATKAAATATQRPPATATAVPTHTATHTATPSPTYTATHTATPSPTYTATHTATPSPTHPPTFTATPRPTATPHPSPVPWFGPAVAHAFFAEGYTGTGYHEYLSLLNPRSTPLRAQLSIYRADGATRLLALRIDPLTRRTLDLNVLAPRASTALTLEADGQVIAERALYSENGHLVAGVNLPSRHWYIPEAYVGDGYRDSLRIFNPYDTTTYVTIIALRGDGSVAVSHRVVGGGKRLNVLIDDVALLGASGLDIQTTEPTVIESVVRTSTMSGPTAAMGINALSHSWYFPDGSTSRGNREFITMINPGSQTATVTLYPVVANGYQQPATLHVGPHARAVYVMQGLLTRSGMAAVVQSNQPIAAQEVRYTSTGGASIVNGSPTLGTHWALAEGNTGHGFKQWVILLNPTKETVHTTMRLITSRGVVKHVTETVKPYQRLFVYLNDLVKAGPISALLDTDHPIVVGRTLIFNTGKGLSTSVGVPVTP